MSNREFVEHLSVLKLNFSEAAQFLGVSERTARRWVEGESVPGPVEAALRAWRRLDAQCLPWKPDSVSVFDNDQDQIRRIREHEAAEHRVLTQPLRLVTFKPLAFNANDPYRSSRGWSELTYQPTNVRTDLIAQDYKARRSRTKGARPRGFGSQLRLSSPLTVSSHASACLVCHLNSDMSRWGQ